MESMVIGATGIVGGNILDALVQAGQRPYALSRQPHSCDRVEWIEGNLIDPHSFQMPLVEVVYCTAEIGLLAAALPVIAPKSLKRVVVFTSTSVVTKIKSEIREERELMQRLLEGEQRLREVCEQLGVAWTVLRPTMIYAEGRDANVSRLAHFIRRFGFMPLMGTGDGLRQPVHAHDLAIGAVSAAKSGAAFNRIYDLAGGEVITYHEMVGRIFDGLGKPRRIVCVQPDLWRLAFAVLKPLLPGANVAMGSRMSNNHVFDCRTATCDFGWKPRKFHPDFASFF